MQSLHQLRLQHTNYELHPRHPKIRLVVVSMVWWTRRSTMYQHSFVALRGAVFLWFEIIVFVSYSSPSFMGYGWIWALKQLISIDFMDEPGKSSCDVLFVWGYWWFPFFFQDILYTIACFHFTQRRSNQWRTKSWEWKSFSNPLSEKRAHFRTNKSDRISMPQCQKMGIWCMILVKL